MLIEPTTLAKAVFTITLIVNPKMLIEVNGKCISVPEPENIAYVVEKEWIHDTQWKNHRHYRLVIAR
ncbi:hypothetical protein [uncultured Endozoicomonas sp.]|uniref:hypothetical protein n=1 Tax=uncultured Endozoicomonas sp. TaxID=432652 RepID=UPI0026353F58|nr:hypothetical protein [uncultured Endozoicomonas sp.]